MTGPAAPQPQPTPAAAGAPTEATTAVPAVVPLPLSARAAVIRAALEPSLALVPAPRSPGDAGTPDGAAAGGPDPELPAALESLVARLAALEAPGAPAAHRLLVHVDAVTATGVPEAGWSVTAGYDDEDLAGAAACAGTLHDDVAALRDRLDDAGHGAAALAADALATSLRVVRVVADLECLDRDR